MFHVKSSTAIQFILDVIAFINIEMSQVISLTLMLLSNKLSCAIDGFDDKSAETSAVLKFGSQNQLSEVNRLNSCALQILLTSVFIKTCLSVVVSLSISSGINWKFYLRSSSLYGEILRWQMERLSLMVLHRRIKS